MMDMVLPLFVIVFESARNIRNVCRVDPMWSTAGALFFEFSSAVILSVAPRFRYAILLTQNFDFELRSSLRMTRRVVEIRR